MAKSSEVAPTEIAANEKNDTKVSSAKAARKSRNTLEDQALIQELSWLMNRVRKGDLEARAEVTKFDGPAAEVIGVVNQTLEAVTIQFNQMLEAVSKTTDFDFTHKVEFSYEGLGGEFQFVLSTLIKRLQEAQNIANNIASGDLSDAEKIKAYGGGTGKRCENDHFSPAF